MSSPEWSDPATPWLGGKRALWFHAAVICSFLAASSVPTPLYRVYQEMWGLAPVAITAVFAIYAFGPLSSLPIFGSGSAQVGRHPVIALTLLLNIGAMALFASAEGAAGLLVARAVQGFATGAAMSTLGAALIDDDPLHGPLANSISPLFGMAVGTLGSGFLIDMAPHPLVTGYAVMGAVLLAELALLALTAETAPKRPGLLRALRPVVAVPQQARRTLLILTPFNIGCWALAGLYLSLVPAIVKQASGITSLLVGGGIVASLNIAGGSAILIARGFAARTLLIGATLAATGGIALFMAGISLSSVLLMLIGTMITGCGFGPAFLAVVRTITPLAKPHERGGLMAAFLIESYLAFSLPALAAGLAAGPYGLVSVAQAYGALVVAAVLTGSSLALYRKLV